MSRIRSIHTEQWTDDGFIECSPLARLLAIGVRNYADDNGVFEWNPKKLKIRILPVDNCDIEELLEELITTEQVMKYKIGSKDFGMIRSFAKFQRPKKPTFKFPVPVDYDPENPPEGYEPNTKYLDLVRNEFSSGGELVGESALIGEERREGERSGEDNSLSSGDDSPNQAENDVKSTVPNCPHLEIIELYHQKLPQLPKVIPSRWKGSQREKHLVARWREDPKHQSLEFWERFFTRLALPKYGFYHGENDRSWKADLGWIVKKENFIKLLEKFINDSAAESRQQNGGSN